MSACHVKYDLAHDAQCLVAQPRWVYEDLTAVILTDSMIFRVCCLLADWRRLPHWVTWRCRDQNDPQWLARPGSTLMWQARITRPM